MTPHRTLRILWRPRRHLGAPPFADNCRCDVKKPHNARDDTVGDGPGARVVGKEEAEPTVDDAERDYGSSEPDVRVGPEGAALVLLEELMMQHAEGGHEEYKDEEENADNGVVGVNLSSSSAKENEGLSVLGATYVW